MTLSKLRLELHSYASNKKAEYLPRFFKAGPGEYAEGDKFLGIGTPNSRRIAKKYKDLPLNQIKNLISSKIHEERLVALLILVDQFKRADQKLKELIYNFYLKNTKHINNWDLVDLSADKIVGEYLFENPNCVTIFKGRPLKGLQILKHLAKSEKIWERRISIISTFYFIRKGKFEDTLKISKILLEDRHDLIHKAVGWMLREVGKRSIDTEKEFLKIHYKKMPRTMLRYAIEKFPDPLRKAYLAGTI